MSCRHATPARTEPSIWLDDLSRRQLSDGSFAALVRDRHVKGATLSLAAFAKTLVDSDVYQAQVQELALREASADEALRALIAYDARWACDVLHQVYARSSGVDGRVSVGLDPRSAHDTSDRIVAEARALWWLVDRPNLVIAIPATRPGLSAITACLAEGIIVNAAQICSRAHHADALAAFLAGVEWARLAGRDLTAIASQAAAGMTPPLLVPPECDIPDCDEAQHVEDDRVAIVNTAWYQVDLELGKASRNAGTAP